MAKRDELQRVGSASRAEWRAWPAVHHQQKESIWLEIWKKGRGPHVPSDEIVAEALCFGWIDSQARKLDENRSLLLLLSPRRPGSRWSIANKERVQRLTAQGLIMPAGQAKIDPAQSDGTWTALDGVEALEVPPDLAAALAASSATEHAFATFPRSARRAILEWILAAKRPEMRAKRIAETVAEAGAGRRANVPNDRQPDPTIG